MKKIKLNKSALLKFLIAATVFGFYWYFINKKLISDSNQAFGLVSYFLLMCAATAYFPLPANLLVLGAVKTASPLVVALVGSLATLVAYFSEYIFFTIMFKFNRVANFKNTWLYQRMSPLFERARFLILVFVSFLPIPSEPLRIYAITQKYSKIQYAASGFVGRLPRYFLLGYFGKDYVNSGWFILAVFIFPGLFLLTIRGGVSLMNFVKTRFLNFETEKSPVSVPAPVSSTRSDMPGSQTEDSAQ